MPIYDTTFVLNPQLEEAGIDGSIKETVDVIGTSGGKIVKENRIGMRRLAYEINKLTQGYYVSLVYEGDGQLVKELERRFRLDENCLRFLTCLYQEPTVVLDTRRSDHEETGKKEAPAKSDEQKEKSEKAEKPEKAEEAPSKAAPETEAPSTETPDAE